MKLNYCCPLMGYGGYAVHARNLALALEREGINLTYFPIYGMRTNELNEDEEKVKHLVEKRFDMGWRLNDITLRMSIASPNQVIQMHGKKRIFYTLLEVSKLPETWSYGLNQMDQVWTPTHWSKNMFIDSGVKEELIKVVPEGVDSSLFKPMKDNLLGKQIRDFGEFKFLCFGKYEKRKGHKVLMKAFAEEFDKNENVSLYIQSDNPWEPKKDFYQEVFKLNLSQHPLIKPFDINIPTSKLPLFYNSFDAFVLPTRGEGWGLPVCEAMACELPVIVPKVTGMTEYITEDNAFILRTRGLEQVDVPLPGVEMEAGMRWYRPDKNHLKSLMREVYENEGKAEKKAKQGRKDMKKFSWNNAAKKACSLLEELDE